MIIPAGRRNPAAVCAFVYAGVTGAMVNTILVIGQKILCYTKNAYAKAPGVHAGAVLENHRH